MFLRAMVLSGALAVVSSCESPCDIVTSSPATVCLQSGGSVQPGVGFVLQTEPQSSTPVCEVRVNGAELELVITGNRCWNRGVGSAEPEAPSPASCTVPGLAEGTYSVRGTSTTFTVPGGVPACDQPQAAF